MTCARSTLIDLNATAFYHCISRCVRRAFLCGKDIQTGQDFRHRKYWIVNRIKQLANIFAIHICAYAVMNNHYHLVLFVNEKLTNHWQDDEIIRRWSNLFPKDAASLAFLETHLVQAKISLWRERLSSISWFMRCINET